APPESSVDADAREHVPAARPFAPGPSLLATPSVLSALHRSPLDCFTALTRRYGRLVRLRFAFWDALVVWQPDDVKHVLQDRHTIYTKDSLDYGVLKRILGDGLVTSDGALWLRQRRLMQQAFHRRCIETFASLMVERTLAMLATWESAVRDGTPV